MDGAIRLQSGIDWRLVEGRVVAWVGETGATHALDAGLSLLLCRIAQTEGRDAAALADLIVAEVAEDCQGAFPDWFDQALARLTALGLIAP